MSAQLQTPTPDVAAREAIREAIEAESARMRATPSPDFAVAILRIKLEIISELIAFLGSRLTSRLSVAVWSSELPPVDRALTAAQLRASAATNPTAESLYALGRALSRNGMKNEARMAFARAVASPVHPGARAHAFVVENALFELAVLERGIGAKAEARTHIARALRRIPSFGKDQPIAADILLESGETRAGLSAFGRAYAYGHRYPAELVLPDWSVRAPVRNRRFTFRTILAALGSGLVAVRRRVLGQ